MEHLLVVESQLVVLIECHDGHGYAGRVVGLLDSDKLGVHLFQIERCAADEGLVEGDAFLLILRVTQFADEHGIRATL